MIPRSSADWRAWADHARTMADRSDMPQVAALWRYLADRYGERACLRCAWPCAARGTRGVVRGVLSPHAVAVSSLECTPARS